MFNLGNRFLIIILALTTAFASLSVNAQDSNAKSDLEDFIHYALVANLEFAEAYAIKLIRNEMSDEDFFRMVTATKQTHERFDRAIGWAMYVDDLEPLAARLETRFETGRTDLIRNAERLNESIELLGGTTRQRLLAEKRLQEAGEYAVPALLATLQVSDDAATARTVREMLVSIQRDAVLPLTVALPHLDDNSKVLIAKTLGDIGYPQAGPALLERLKDSKESPAVQRAASQALGQIGVNENVNNSLINTVVAKQFFDREVSVLPQAIGGTNLFWQWDDQNHLVALDVPEEAFADVMAMFFASQALGLNAQNEQAMSLFVAANLRRDRALGGQGDLVYGNLPYSPAFYATVFGPNVAQLVLAEALGNGETALSLEAISALAETAGAESLLAGDKPLMAAMYYPDRRVQYEAALTLASTLPTQTFAGSYRVVPLLASAVRSSGDMYAIVVGEDEDTRRDAADLLSANGWTVAGQGLNSFDAINAAGIVPGIDLAVVFADNADQGAAIANELAQRSETTVTPVFVMTSGGDSQVLANMVAARDMVETADSGISNNAKLSVIEDLLAEASGGRLGYEEQLAFSNRALQVLRDIALANTVLEADDATGTLIDALAIADAENRSVIAQTLSMIDDEQAQQALIDAALDSTDLDSRVMLLDESAASVRRWGNMAADWQVEMVVDLAENSSGYLSDAAARLNGALDHPHTSVMILLP